MVKSSKKSATKGEAAGAAIKASKPLNKGRKRKRESSESDEEEKPKTPSTPAMGESSTLRADNLSFDIGRKAIEDFFQECGEVVDVIFATRKNDGKFMGFGFVDFATSEQAVNCLKLDGIFLLGRKIHLTRAPQSGNYKGDGCFDMGGGRSGMGGGRSGMGGGRYGMGGGRSGMGGGRSGRGGGRYGRGGGRYGRGGGRTGGRKI